MDGNFLDKAEINTTHIIHPGAYCHSGKGVLGYTPHVDFFYNYWLTLKQQSEDSGPTRQQIRPSDFTQYLSKIALVDVKDNEGKYRFEVRIIGTHLTIHYGEITGQCVSSIDNPKTAERIWYMCNTTVEKKEPLLLQTVELTEKQSHLSAFGFYMPLLDAYGEVEKILIYVDVHINTVNKYIFSP